MYKAFKYWWHRAEIKLIKSYNQPSAMTGNDGSRQANMSKVISANYMTQQKSFHKLKLIEWSAGIFLHIDKAAVARLWKLYRVQIKLPFRIANAYLTNTIIAITRWPAGKKTFRRRRSRSKLLNVNSKLRWQFPRLGIPEKLFVFLESLLWLCNRCCLLFAICWKARWPN